MREVLITPEARLNEWVLTKFFNFRCNLIGVDRCPPESDR